MNKEKCVKERYEINIRLLSTFLQYLTIDYKSKMYIYCIAKRQTQIKTNKTNINVSFWSVVCCTNTAAHSVQRPATH